ncbi:hypothetical protein GALL_402020 [mine drainage metagenome]|uniref:Uncharacterized protein n=1 Tax=mine drainage metagenome TaxID=410659 RepID=A0A1J5QDP1_9ZZZZ
MDLLHRCQRILRSAARLGTRLPPERQRALDLLAAIDAGGVPLIAGRINDIARQLGLEVSVKAPMDETIARIRVCARSWQ